MIVYLFKAIDKNGTVVGGNGMVLIGCAEPQCWVREGYAVVKAEEVEDLQAK